MNDVEIRCIKCTRFLGIKGVKTIIARVRCPNSKCKALNNVKIITSNATDEQLRYKFEEIENEQFEDQSWGKAQSDGTEG